jgi:cytochrome c oxidase subunit II
MPPPVRRFVRVLTCLAVLALANVSPAAAGNGGLAPVAPASPNAKNIRDIYWLILGVTGGIFVLVIGTLLVFVIKYRSRGRAREIEGPQVRGHTNLELAWTAGPVILLAIIAGFVFWKVSDIGATSSQAASERQAKDEIVVEGHQFYWDFRYPNGAISVDTMRVPFNRAIKLTVRSADVDHSWWIPALGGKIDAIPGKTNHQTFRATKLGTFVGQCAEFCGLLHAAMLAHVEVLPPGEYDSWVSARANAQLELGKETFVGVCAKCHGLAAQGGVGPDISHNALLGDKNGISKIIRQGTGKMPAVGNDWSQEQLDATIAYLQQRFVTGGSGGGQG